MPIALEDPNAFTTAMPTCRGERVLVQNFEVGQSKYVTDPRQHIDAHTSPSPPLVSLPLLWSPPLVAIIRFPFTAHLDERAKFDWASLQFITEAVETTCGVSAFGGAGRLSLMLPQAAFDQFHCGTNSSVCANVLL